MEIALCMIAAAYFAFAFRDVQSVLYMAGVAYVLHMFINNPRLFSNGPATTNNTVRIDQQASVPHSHEQEQPPSPTPTATNLLTQSLQTSASPTPTPTAFTPVHSSQPAQRTVQRKTSRYTFDPVKGGAVHSPLVSASSVPISPSGTRRPHRVPDVSAGRSPLVPKSPILPVLSASPVSYLPNEFPEPSVAHGEVLNQIVHTEMVKTPTPGRTNQATAAESSPHRRIGSHHRRHHQSHSRSHHRQRSSRSPMMSFSDATAAGSGDHDYESDSSHASTSSTRSTTSTRFSYGLPSYEKHVRVADATGPLFSYFEPIKKYKH